MDIKDTFIAANSALTDLVQRVRPEHLSLEVPAYARFHDGQTLRTSLNIMAYENQCVPRVLAGETGLATNPEFDGDLLRDDSQATTSASPPTQSVRPLPRRPRSDRPHVICRRPGEWLPVRYLAQPNDGPLRRRGVDRPRATSHRRGDPRVSTRSRRRTANSCEEWGSSRPRSRSRATPPRRIVSWPTSAGSPGTRPRHSHESGDLRRSRRYQGWGAPGWPVIREPLGPRSSA